MKRRTIINIPSIIDVEASGFGTESYPIEVGVVRDDGARYCKIINPFDDWTHWNNDAAKLHGIERDVLLRKGVCGQQICIELNDFIGTRPVYSDGWVVDSPWLIKLFERSRVPMAFRVSSIEMILKEYQYPLWDQAKEVLISSYKMQRHRASSDALIIQQTYLNTI